jgi:hypothetical protein
MSTELISRKPLLFDDIRDFSEDGVYVDTVNDDNSLILTDGTNYLWAVETDEVKYPNSEHKGILFIRYAGNYPERIIEAIEKHFDTKLATEYSDEFEMLLAPFKDLAVKWFRKQKGRYKKSTRRDYGYSTSTNTDA